MCGSRVDKRIFEIAPRTDLLVFMNLVWLYHSVVQYVDLHLASKITPPLQTKSGKNSSIAVSFHYKR